MGDFEWSKPTEDAAELIAQSVLSLAAVADQIGVNRCTIYRWRKHPEFAGRVEEHLANYREEVRRGAAPPSNLLCSAGEVATATRHRPTVHL